jgi:hypothetical protein
MRSNEDVDAVRDELVVPKLEATYSVAIDGDLAQLTDHPIVRHMTIEHAENDLRVRLDSGELAAYGVQSHRRQAIPPYSWGARALLWATSRVVDDESGEIWTDVRFKRADVQRLWPQAQDAAETFGPRMKRGPKAGNSKIKRDLFEDLYGKLQINKLRGMTNRGIADSLDYERRYKNYTPGTMEKYVGEVMRELKDKYSGLFEPSE